MIYINMMSQAFVIFSRFMFHLAQTGSQHTQTFAFFQMVADTLIWWAVIPCLPLGQGIESIENLCGCPKGLSFTLFTSPKWWDVRVLCPSLSGPLLLRPVINMIFSKAYIAC